MARARRGPLRMIRGEVWLPSSVLGMNIKHDLLECGHIQRPVTDWGGEVASFRRRCVKCSKGAPADYTPEQVADINARFPAYQFEEHKCVGCRKVIYYHRGDKVPSPVKCGDCLAWERARRQAGRPSDCSAGCADAASGEIKPCK